MRAYAAQLRQSAEIVATTGSAMLRTADNLTYQGPAGDGFRTRMQWWRGEITGAAQALNEAADALVRSAGEVEAARAEEARRQRAEQEQQTEATRRASANADGQS